LFAETQRTEAIGEPALEGHASPVRFLQLPSFSGSH
jgi:hypothetical protein